MYFETEKKGEGWLYEKERKTGIHTPMSEKTTGEEEETAHRCPDTPTHIIAGCPHGAWCLKVEKNLESPGEHLSLSG